jgi:hypothetical protein
MGCVRPDMMHSLLHHRAAQQFAFRRFHCRREQRTVSFFRYSIAEHARTFAAST